MCQVVPGGRSETAAGPGETTAQPCPTRLTGFIRLGGPWAIRNPSRPRLGRPSPPGRQGRVRLHQPFLRDSPLLSRISAILPGSFGTTKGSLPNVERSVWPPGAFSRPVW